MSSYCIPLKTEYLWVIHNLFDILWGAQQSDEQKVQSFISLSPTALIHTQYTMVAKK